MVRATSIEDMRRSHKEHPAVKAWNEVRPDRTRVTGIEVVVGSSSPTTVYRLKGVGEAGSTVIAKRCQQRKGLIERAVYEEILPQLPLPMMQYYGFLQEPDGEYCWLFVEDVSREKYDPRRKRHRIAAARWLGVMNVSAADNAVASRLPQRMPDHYLKLLRSARAVMLSNASNPALGPADLATLKRVVHQCDHLEGIWRQLESSCDGMPQSLVHGDFIRKNVGARAEGDQITLLPFDWENAGWGVPAEDISKVDITAYWITVKEHWPRIGIGTLKRMAVAGEVFRCLVFLGWIAPRLAREEVAQSISDLALCETWLADLIQGARWRG